MIFVLTGEHMSDITIALDAGHGGSDPGAVYGNRNEKDDALRLTKAVGKILEDSGINVFYVRKSDEYETPFKKATDANNAGADYFISIHRNSSEEPNQYSGVESLVYRDSGIRSVIAKNINSELEKVGFNNLGITQRPNLVVLKRTRMPAVLVEAGFINSDEDNAIFDENFEKIANAIAQGILKSIYSETTSTEAREESSEYSDSIATGSSVHENDSIDNSLDKSLDNSQDVNSTANPDFYSDMDRAMEEDMNNNMNTVMDNSMNNNMNNNTNNNMDNNMNNSNDNVGSNISSDLAGNMLRDNMQNIRPMNMSDNYTNDTDRNICPCERNGLYRVQTGAFNNKENADRMLNSLVIEGFPAYIIYEDNLYKVQVGAFRFLANAIKMEHRLRRYRYNTFIVYK